MFHLIVQFLRKYFYNYSCKAHDIVDYQETNNWIEINFEL